MVYLHLLLQPPWDTELGDKYIIHYTYGCDYNMQVTESFCSCLAMSWMSVYVKLQLPVYGDATIPVETL
jgi:hypothetical protein